MDVFADQGKVRAIYHVSVGVSDIERARRFYSAILLPLGYQLLHEIEDGGKITSLGWGLHFPELWTSLPSAGAAPDPGSGIHIAFHAANSGAVDHFYAAALALGGTDNGPPDYRPDYAPGYYAAFVLDPDKNKLEAVWFDQQRSGPT